jgi:hypothetical protein
MTVASRFSLSVADVVDCLVLTSLRTGDVAAFAAIWLVLPRRYDEPLFGAALKSKVGPGRTARQKLFSRWTEAFDYCRKIAITLIDPDRPVLNECYRLVSTMTVPTFSVMQRKAAHTSSGSSRKQPDLWRTPPPGSRLATTVDNNYENGLAPAQFPSYDASHAA